MLRRILIAMLALVPCGQALAASNVANLAVLGFAHDGSAFAFEQYGWSSGAKYPYSDLSVISAASGQPLVE